MTAAQQQIVIEAGEKLGLDPKVVAMLATEVFITRCPFTGTEEE